MMNVIEFTKVFPQFTLKGRPLSDFTFAGNKNVENTLSTIGITFSAAIDLVISTTGNREYSSMMTSRYSPVSTGPQKSIEMCCHGPSGNSDVLSGVCLLVFVLTAH